MAITKGTGTAIWTNQTVNTTSSAVNVATDYSGKVMVNITLTGAPTVGAVINVQESFDGTTFYQLPGKSYTSGLSATVYAIAFAIEPETTSFKLSLTIATGGTTSVTAQYNNITAI